MDGAKPLPKLNKDKLQLVFDQLDIDKGTGRLIGNLGGADVTVLSSAEALSIIERTMSGSLQVTVIYLSQLPDGTFKAVHSRHTAMFGGVPLPSQTYGACQLYFNAKRQLTLVEADVRFIEARYARILFDSPAA